jgi:hypothetical protein
VIRLVRTQRQEGPVSSVPAESGWARTHGAIGNVNPAQRATIDAKELNYAHCVPADGASNCPDANGQGTNPPQFQAPWQARPSNLPTNLQGQQP